MQTENANPIVIVTGANAGVGFGICHRLLIQMSYANPPDATLPLEGQKSLATQDLPPTKYTGLTLILACRNAARAEVARLKLLKLLDAHFESLRRSEHYDGHAEVFRRGVQVDFVRCDLSSSSGVFDFCDEVERSYPYVSHLVCNAGIIDYHAMDWVVATKQFATDIVGATTQPLYRLEKVGTLNEEGIGLTFQSNYFGHYTLARRLDPMLRRCPLPSRVLWTSSLDAWDHCFDVEDWQNVRSPHSYSGTKYAIDLYVTELNASTPPEDAGQTRHVLVHPGITRSSLVVPKMILGWFFDYMLVLVFYVSIFCGSKHNFTESVKGAVSATFGILAPLSSLPPPSDPVKIGSRIYFRGQPFVELDPVDGWESRRSDAAKLVQKSDALYAALLEKRKLSVQNGHGNGNGNGH